MATRRKHREGSTESVLRREWSIVLAVLEMSQKVKTEQQASYLASDDRW